MKKEQYLDTLLFQVGVLLVKMVSGIDYGNPHYRDSTFYEFLRSQDVTQLWTRLEINEVSNSSKP